MFGRRDSQLPEKLADSHEYLLVILCHRPLLSQKIDSISIVTKNVNDRRVLPVAVFFLSDYFPFLLYSLTTSAAWQSRAISNERLSEKKANYEEENLCYERELVDKSEHLKYVDNENYYYYFLLHPQFPHSVSIHAIATMHEIQELLN